jgi:hypothetical protein
MITYTFTLRDRTLALYCGESVVESQQIELADARPTLRYDSLFVALRKGLGVLSRHAGLLRQDDDRRWDHKKLAELLRDGELQINLIGESRESEVGAFYILNELDVDSGVTVDVIEQAESTYETFQFRTDLEPLSSLGDVFESFTSAGKKLNHVKKLSMQTERLDQSIVEKNHFRIGVLGQTGAGKSTFLNALLGRRVLSLHEDICTGTIIEICYVEDRAAEGVEPEFVSLKRYESRVREITEKIEWAEEKQKDDQGLLQRFTSSEGHEATTQLLTLRAHLEQLAEYRPLFEHPSKKRSLSEVDRFVSVADENLLPQFVEKVTIHLHEPFLQFVTILDTPGLRDPDPQRRRQGINAVADLDGWIYLVEAPNAISQTVIDDLKEIREEANNPHGVILLSKVDALTSPSGNKTLDDLLVQRRETYRDYTEHPIPFCSAMGPEQVAAIRDASSQTLRDQLATGLFGKSYGFPFIRRQTPPLDAGFIAKDTLQEGYREHLQNAHRTGDYNFIFDLLLESSSIIPAMRQLAALLNQTILGGQVQRGRRHLLDVLESRLKWLRNRQESLTEQLKVCEDRDKTKLLLIETKKEFEEASNELEKARDVRRELLDSLDSRKDKLRKAAEQKKKKIRTALTKAVRQQMENQYSYTLLGTRAVSLFNIVDSPMSARLSKVLQNIRDEFCQEVESSVPTAVANSIQQRFADELTGFSLHAKKQHTVEADEKLFEWYSSTVERMQEIAGKSATIREKDILRKAKTKVTTLGRVTKKELERWIEWHSNEVKRLDDEATELEERFSELEDNVSVAREAIVQALDKVQNDLDALTEFKSTLPQYKAFEDHDGLDMPLPN